MTTDFKRMQQRGKTEADWLASDEVPFERELVVASDTGAFWIGNGTDTPVDLPKQGPITVDVVTGMATLPDGTNLPTVDGVTGQLPGVLRATLTVNFSDPTTPEGAAIAELIAAGGGGAAPLSYDPATGLYSVPVGSDLTYDSASGLYTTN